jgi:hypothetical protein
MVEKLEKPFAVDPAFYQTGLEIVQHGPEIFRLHAHASFPKEAQKNLGRKRTLEKGDGMASPELQDVFPGQFHEHDLV